MFYIVTIIECANKIISIKFSSVEEHRQLYEKVKNNKTMYIAHILLKSTNDIVLETAKKQIKISNMKQV